MSELQTDMNNLYSLYNDINRITQRHVYSAPIVVEEKKISIPVEDFKYNRVSIHIKKGDGDFVEGYNGKVISYSDTGSAMSLTAVDSNIKKRIHITSDTPGVFNVVIEDKNGTVDSKFTISHMQLKNIDEPKKLSLIKVEQ
jgi:hypothetical protein